jgi:hypothetical protein
MPLEYASVGISPAYQEAAPGTPLNFTVSAQSTMGGTVAITVPFGLVLVGDPICSGPCRGPFVSPRTDLTFIEVTLDGESALVSFTVLVNHQASAGATFNISATLVGGPQAVEMSSATVYVTQAAPTQPPSAMDDNRMLYLQMNPQFLRMAPAGDALFHIQPVRWGTWTGSSPNVAISINIPVGLTAASDPFCGRDDVIPTKAPCGVASTEEPDGSTTYSITPGYNTIDQTANGIYLVLITNDGLETGTTVQVNVSAVVDDETLAKQPHPVTSTVHSVDIESLFVQQATAGSTGAVLELRQGYSQSGASCSAAPSDSQVGLYEYGLETRFSIATMDTGKMGEATDGSGEAVCHIPVLFDNVPPRDIYILATSYGDDIPCRACVYGFITPTNNAEIVFAQP